MSVYCPWPTAILRMSLVRVWLRKAAALGPLTQISPMCEMSKMPAALRTARCSSMMLEYWTGISQPPNSMSLPPRRWWAAKSGVRFNVLMKFGSSPLLGLHLLLGQLQFFEHKLLGGGHE